MNAINLKSLSVTDFKNLIGSVLNKLIIGFKKNKVEFEEIKKECFVFIEAVNMAFDATISETPDGYNIHIQKCYPGDSDEVTQTQAVFELAYFYRYARERGVFVFNTTINFDKKSGYTSADFVLPFNWGENLDKIDIDYVYSEFEYC